MKTCDFRSNMKSTQLSTTLMFLAGIVHRVAAAPRAVTSSANIERSSDAGYRLNCVGKRLSDCINKYSTICDPYGKVSTNGPDTCDHSVCWCERQTGCQDGSDC